MATSEDRPSSQEREDQDVQRVNLAGQGLHVVGIGASAGGLEAFEQVLRSLQVDTGMAFVLVQHLDPNHPSLLCDILSRTTSMPVTEVTQGEIVQPNHIYIAPPNAAIQIGSGKLSLTPRTSDGKAWFPIDAFFFSLAHAYKQDAIGIVLSGNGSDGAKGLTAIMVEGGTTFAQDRKSAKFDSMPAAAIASGADFVLSPEETANELVTIARSPKVQPVLHRKPLSDSGDDNDNFVKVLTVLRTKHGMDFSQYKVPTVQRRIFRRMASHRFQRVAQYLDFLKTNPTEVNSLFESILVKVTCFFRDSDSFAALTEQAFPAIFSRNERKRSIRVWVPGCATGEEAYSIAIGLLEYMEKNGLNKKIEIFATDISETALAKARTGFFEESIAENVSPDRLQRFFVKEGVGYRVTSVVRECCIFAKQDVTHDPPFSKLDLISCRNLLIYLTSNIQKRVLSSFHFGLNQEGFLYLGGAETIGTCTDLFCVTDKVNRIFFKKNVLRGSVDLEFAMNPLRTPTDVQINMLPTRSEPTTKRDIKEDADRAVIAKFVPPGVVVNERLEIIQFRGDTSPYLLHPPGEVTNSLMKMCRPGILPELRASVHEAAASGEPVRKDSWIKAAGNLQSSAVQIDVIPFTPSTTNIRYCIVLFSPRPTFKKEGPESTQDTLNEIERLERELVETKDYLNTVIAKEETTNEELKSMSEEILSANEELQSTNEEMATAQEETQAANEELVTVNQELQNRNQELTRASSDLMNIFGSIQIPIVMLSEKLVIRHFTPSAERVLHLSRADMGRPLAEVASKLPIDGLLTLATEVVESLNTKEQEVVDLEGRWYSLRIKPYRSVDNKIEGAIIALVDIDSLKKSFTLLEEARAYADAIVQTIQVPLLVLDSDLRVVTANRAFFSHFRVSPTDTIGYHVFDLGNKQWNLPRLRSLLAEVYSKSIVMEDIEVEQEFPLLGRRVMQLNARILVQYSDKPGKILLAIDDLTQEMHARKELKVAKETAESANQAKSAFLANMSHEIRTPLAAIVGYAEILESPELAEGEVTRFATRIRKNVEQLTELIDEILDLSKIEAGKLEVDLVQFSFITELSETLALLRNRATNRGLDLMIRFENDIPAIITTSPKRLRQILFNIVGNALKFTEKGNVSILVKLQTPTSRKKKPMLCFVVSDTGCGLSLEQQKRLFHPFTQADSSVTRKFGGTGLGLVLAKRLAESLGGDVALTESTQGKGSTFTISIDPGPLDGVPRLKDLTAESLEKQPEFHTNGFTPNQKLAGVTVLVVEDGSDNQAITSRFLTSSGAQVELASNGEEAIQKIQNGTNCDVVIMDIQMPILDGLEATRMLRALGYRIPIIAFTAHAMQGEREKCIAAGCTDYVKKPVKPNALVDTILKTVDKAKTK